MFDLNISVMFWCDHIYFEQNTSKNSVFLQKMLNSCQNSQITLSFCQNDDKYTRKSNELLKYYNYIAFSQQLLSQNLKFERNIGLNIPTPFGYHFNILEF